MRRSWLLIPSAAAGAGAGFGLDGISPAVAGGAAIGLAPAIAAGLTLDLRGHKLSTAADFERWHDLETMGIIGRFEQAPGSAFPRDDHPEALQAYKELAATLRVRGGRDMRAVLVTSPGPEEGKSTTAANLATVLAQTGSKVVLVDADLRWSSLRSTNANASSLGLSGLLLNYLHTPQLAVVRTNENNLYLLPSGVLPPNPQELLALPRLADILASLREMADYVIVDSPPLLEADDAKLLAGALDATLLVTLAGKTRSRDVDRALRLLAEAEAVPLGAVLNRVKTPRPAAAPATAPAARPQPMAAPIAEAAPAPVARPAYEPFSVAAFRNGPPKPVGVNTPRPVQPAEEPAILRLAQQGLDAQRPQTSPANAGMEGGSQAVPSRNLRLVRPDERPIVSPVADWQPVSAVMPPAEAVDPAAPLPTPSAPVQPRSVEPAALAVSPSVDEVLAHMEETLRLIREMRKEKSVTRP